MRDPLLLTLILPVYRALLMALPGTSVDNLVRETTEAFRDACRHVHRTRGVFGLARVTVVVVFDLVTRIALEWIDRLQHRSPELNRQTRNTNLMDTLAQDIRYAFPIARNSP